MIEQDTATTMEDFDAEIGTEAQGRACRSCLALLVRVSSS